MRYFQLGMTYMTGDFSIKQWAAWAPGLNDPSAWATWWAAPSPVVGEDVPALLEMPAMMRRRVERLGRAALQVAYRAMEGASPCPVVFASRYGDMQRSVALMKQLATEGTVSPAAFSMSVHNAFAAMFSIARGDRSNYSAVSAGAETAENAFVEAVALLVEGASEVMVVYYDEPLPAPLAHFSPPQEFIRAWACRIGPALADEGVMFSRVRAGADAPDTTDETAPCGPPDIALLRFLAGSAAAYRRRVDGMEWRWQRA